jgi:hypothetical protein
MKSLYAIRHKPTGFMLPEPTGRQNRGSSHTEPVDCTNELPRLFQSELAAKRSLTQWLRGKHIAVMGTEYDDFSGRAYTYQECTEVFPQPHRKREDMEVVEITLSVRDK